MFITTSLADIYTNLFKIPYYLMRSSSTTSGRSRFSIGSPLWLVTLGVLALALAHFTQEGASVVRDDDQVLLGKHSISVESVVVDPGRRWLVSTGGDGSVYLWDIARRKLTMALEREAESAATFAYCAAFTPDGSRVGAAFSDGSVTLWNVLSGGRQTTLQFNSAQVRGLAFSPDGRLMAIGGANHAVILLDIATMRTRQRLIGSDGQINCVVFSPDGRTLASACADGTANLWDVSSGANIRTLTMTENGSRPLIGVAFSPEGKVLATASLYSGLALWDVVSGRQLESPRWPDEFATALAFSPAGKTLAWGTVTGTIELWDIVAGQRISAWGGHSGAVKSLAFFPDAMTLASGGDDGAVRVWHVPGPRVAMNPLLGSTPRQGEKSVSGDEAALFVGDLDE
jgi:WD40 repeat protein